MVESSSKSPVIRALNHLNKGKRRRINMEKWKKENKKTLRNSGKAYLNYKNIPVAEKLGPTTARSCSCNFDGCKIITLEERKIYFNDFYSKSYNEQSQFLSSCMEVLHPLRRRVNEAISQRQCTVIYSLILKGKRQRICQMMLTSTFAITRRRIQMLTEKLKSDQKPNDLRGTHNNRPHKIENDYKNLVKEHIASFPCQESHYSRHSNKKMCLNPELNITKMFHLFQEKYPEAKCIKLHTYRDIFKRDFNLRFGVPRSDTCKVCDKNYIQLIAAKNDTDRRKIEIASELHHRKTERAYSNLKIDGEIAKSNPNVIVICVDLQQVIFTPNLTHSDVFYQRQYANYNFCIHDIGSSQVTMCVWHEIIAKRGSSEVASCILNYILKKFKKLNSGEERKLIIWSDRCVDQNNNWKMITLCHYLMTQNFFSEVNQKFLVSGHSFLPCDRDFALIEKQKKSRQLYTPYDVVEMITASRPNNPFNTIEMTQNDFVDLHEIECQIKKDPKIKITEARWIQVTNNEPTTLRIRKCHNILESWSTYEILRKQKGRVVSDLNLLYKKIEPENLPPKYNELLPISKNKKDDLLKMAELLPENQREFYINLPFL